VNDDLDNQLRKALRRVDPGEDFTARVLAQAESEASKVHKHAALKVSRLVWLPAAVAACLVVVVAVTHFRQQRQEEKGLAARDQVMEALRVTSDKLDLAYEIVNNPPPTPAEDGSGA
jgi:hypothetical protein